MPDAVQTPKGRRIENKVLQLRKRSEELNIVISVDDRITEADAALLLNIHKDTMAKRRVAGAGPAFYRRPLRNAHFSYELKDLALWLVDGRVSLE